MASKGRVSKVGLAALNKELYDHIYSCHKTLRRLLTFSSLRQPAPPHLPSFLFSFSLFPIRFLHYFPSHFLARFFFVCFLFSFVFIFILFSSHNHKWIYTHKWMIYFLSFYFLIFSLVLIFIISFSFSLYRSPFSHYMHFPRFFSFSSNLSFPRPYSFCFSI